MRVPPVTVSVVGAVLGEGVVLTLGLFTDWMEGTRRTTKTFTSPPYLSSHGIDVWAESIYRTEILKTFDEFMAPFREDPNVDNRQLFHVTLTQLRDSFELAKQSVLLHDSSGGQS